MLRTTNIPPREMRNRSSTKPHPVFVGLLILAFLMVPLESCASRVDEVSVVRYPLDVVEDDIIAVHIKPVLESVSVECGPLGRGGPFDLEISTDDTDSVFGRKTGIWVRLQSEGTYNLTINFYSNETWDHTIGVYSRNLEFYRDLYGKNVRITGYFVEPPLGTPSTYPSGNWTISIIIDTHSISPSIFSIELPTPVNSVLLITAAGFIAYFNVFLLLDTYFKNRKEIVSNRRWLLTGIVFVISAFAIYQLYTFTTFTLSGGV